MLMIIKDGQAIMQGQVYIGEVHVSFVALADNVWGEVLMIGKPQNEQAMSQRGC